MVGRRQKCFGLDGTRDEMIGGETGSDGCLYHRVYSTRAVVRFGPQAREQNGHLNSRDIALLGKQILASIYIILHKGSGSAT